MTARPTTADPSPGTDGATSPRKAAVFLSYARADKDRAVRLVQGLQAAGLEVWWDTLVEGGAEFARTIEAALHSCDAVVVVWSQASVGSGSRSRRSGAGSGASRRDSRASSSRRSARSSCCPCSAPP